VESDFMKAALIINPIAGQGKSLRVLPKVEQILGAHFRLQIFMTLKTGDGFGLTRQALGKRCDAVIVIGGDGTISETVNALVQSDIPVGILPCGTANVLARELHIPKRIDQACKVIIEGHTRRIDLGIANDRYFVTMAGAGFDAKIVQDVDQNAKRLIKDLAYVLTGVKVLLRYRPSRMTVQVDEGESKYGYFAVVGNARYYAGRFSVTAEASMEDGLLDICIFKKKGIERFARYVAGVVFSKHLDFEDVDYLKGNKVRIEADRPTLVQADGELIGQLPMEFSVVPGAITIFCPGVPTKA
jgi:diacylglycerol kinase (ATP)